MVQKNTGSESCGGVQMNHTWPVAYTLALFKVCNGVRLTRWLQLGLDFDATAIRPRYDHSTTYVTIVSLPECGLLH